LRPLRKLERLWLDYAPITDAGLEHLKVLTSLRELDLSFTKVTNAGLARLQEALPNCGITRNQVIQVQPPSGQ
jgi:hypothetical protein